MKIVILTQYFPPEVGAPQNRLYELAVRLTRKGADVTILTAMPNYPQMKIHHEYKGKLYCSEEMNGLKVYRSWIFVSRKKGLFRRMLNYYSFVFTSFWTGLFKLRRHDILICESPPLFLGKTAYLLSRFKRSRMIFNVSDLWPESAEKLGLVNNRLFLKIAYRLEAFLYRKSWMISGQTQGIVKDISRRFPGKKVVWLPNGVDLNFFHPEADSSTDWKKDNGFSEEDFILLYAGIIGHAQGLEVILKAADIVKPYSAIRFVLLGSGPEKEKLTRMKEELNLKNVHFFDPVGKSGMPDVVRSVNAAVIPLRRLDLFLGAIPSKIFENLAMKKPIILGVEGEAKELFIEEGKAGLFFEPENENQLAEQVLKLYHNPALVAELGNNGYKYVAQKFERDIIVNQFWMHLNEGN